MLMLSFIFFEGYDDHRDLHVLTRSLPTRRSSELEVQRVAQIGRERVIRPGAFLLRNAPPARVQIEAVELRGIIGERGDALGLHPRAVRKLGRGSCRERAGQYGWITVGPGSRKKTRHHNSMADDGASKRETTCRDRQKT